MKLVITQEIKEEIDCNLKLQAELLDVINNAKSNRNITELNESCLDILTLKLQVSEYIYDDLAFYVAKILHKGVINEHDGLIIKQAIMSVDDDDTPFFTDCKEVSSLINKVYKEIKKLKTKEEIESYLDSIEEKLNNDIYFKYIYERAFFKLDTIL